MTAIKVDTDVALPDAASAKYSQYPFRVMSVGESFFAPGKRTAHLVAACYRHKPMRFTVRAVEENGVKGARCWRVS